MTTAIDTVRDTPFVVGGRTFHSRLMVGTGKYRDNETMARAIEAAGADSSRSRCVAWTSIAPKRRDLHHSIRTATSCSRTPRLFHADDAVRYARLAREAGFNEFVNSK